MSPLMNLLGYVTGRPDDKRRTLSLTLIVLALSGDAKAGLPERAQGHFPALCT